MHAGVSRYWIGRGSKSAPASVTRLSNANTIGCFRWRQRLSDPLFAGRRWVRPLCPRLSVPHGEESPLPSVTNSLIDTLPRAARNRLLSICEPVDLVSGNLVSGSDSLIRHVYFPTGSIL